MSVLECPACGAPLKPVIGTAFLECEYCGSRCTRETAGTGSGPTCESLTMRGEICLEAKQWAYAANCFQRALEISPTYAPAYYGSLLADLNCCDDEALGTRDPSFRDHTDFQNALRFSDSALRRKLEAALRKAEENKDFSKAKDKKTKELADRYRKEFEALTKENRGMIRKLWLLPFAIVFVQSIIYGIIGGIIGAITGSSFDFEEIFGYLFLSVIGLTPAMGLVTAAIKHKTQGKPGETPFLFALILGFVLSLSLYLHCAFKAITGIVDSPGFILDLLFMILPCGMVYPVVTLCFFKAKSSAPLREAYRQERAALKAAKP